MKKQLVIGALTAISTAAYAMPNSVDSVTTSSTNATSVTVNWTAVDGAAYYDVYQNNERVGNLIVETSFTATGLTAETNYQYFVTACDAAGVCSDASAQSDVSTLAQVGEQCSADGVQPVVTFADQGNGTFTLNWCSVPNAEGYNLFVNNDYVTTVNASTTSYDISATGDDVLQIAYFANNEFPAKSEPATAADAPASTPDGPAAPLSDEDLLASLENDSLAGEGVTEIFFTRHAEKMTELSENDDGSFSEVCGEDKCSEILNPEGELRAELLADIFNNAGITGRLTHAFSSHKTRTRQTIEQIVADAGLTGDEDKIPNDGIQELPVLNDDGEFATELNPESTSGSEAPTIAALLALPAGSTALVAGHSGTLYDIMAGLGLTDVCLSDTVDTCNEDRYPINEDVKVKNFGDVWKINLVDGVATFIYRVNFQPLRLELNELAN